MTPSRLAERVALEGFHHAQAVPQEFRDDVIRVAQNRDQDVSLAQVAKDFGVRVGALDKWMRQACIEAGEKPGET